MVGNGIEASLGIDGHSGTEQGTIINPGQNTNKVRADAFAALMGAVIIGGGDMRRTDHHKIPVGLVLTQREQEVMRHVQARRKTKDIADELGVSTRTIEAHRYKIAKKLGGQAVADWQDAEDDFPVEIDDVVAEIVGPRKL